MNRNLILAWVMGILVYGPALAVIASNLVGVVVLFMIGALLIGMYLDRKNL